jgi:chromate transporter
MMHDEVVHRRGWVSDERFVDLVGATNLIPGPNSTELPIHLGWDRARGRGLIVAGVCFIAPAAVIVGFLAWTYVTYGDTPALEGVLYGIKPVVIAIIIPALIKLLPTAAKTLPLGLIAAGALATYLAGVNELVVLAGGGAFAAAIALMAGVSIQLIGDAVVDPLTLTITVIAGVALWRTHLNSAWLIASGAAVGIVHTLAT